MGLFWMKVPKWIKSRMGLFWIWVFVSSFIAGMLRTSLDLRNNHWQYMLFYIACLVSGYILSWIQHYYRHDELVEKEIKKIFDKNFPHDAFKKEMVNRLREQLKKEIAEDDARRMQHKWN
jgi:cyanate permease